VTTFIWSQLRHRRSRVSALGCAIALAAISFVLLASTAKTSDLRVRGSVRTNFRNAYDILVRPRASSTQLERSERLVRDNYLSGIFGGITLRQYEIIKNIRGVDVAAPIANIGYIFAPGRIFLSIRPWLNRDPSQLYRVRQYELAQARTSRFSSYRAYVYYARRNRFEAGREITPSGAAFDVCSPFNLGKPLDRGPFDRSAGYLRCYSAQSPGKGSDAAPEVDPRGGVGVDTLLFFPILLAAIDPSQEARLLHIDRTIVSGRFLKSTDRAHVTSVPHHVRVVPVIASTKTFVDEHLLADTDRLEISNPQRVPQKLASPNAYRFVTSLPGTAIGHQSLSATQIYDRLLGSEFTSNNYWRPSETQYRVVRRGHELVPLTTTNPPNIWSNPLYPGGYFHAPPPNEDVQFRRLRVFVGSNLIRNGVLATPYFHVVGRYDVAKLPGFSPLSRVPLETYYPPELEPADDAARQALHGKALLPTENLGDYIQQPPLFLTTLQAMRPLLEPKNFSGADSKAPISVIRVRVKGVNGPDPLSMARIRAVALQVHDKTGLDVDVTAGSSPRELLLHLPAGKFGRPPLLLKEGWVKKGVSVAFLRAVDRKSLALSALILVICCFYLANGAFAVARARRTEIGTLLCLGWSRSAIFRVLLGELVLIGFVVGIVGTAVAAAVAAGFALKLSFLKTLLVLPVSVALAALAGFVPAWLAAASVPLDAVRPPVSDAPHRRRAVNGIWGMAWVNLRRLPVRTMLGAGGLCVGVAALALLLGIERAFNGTLVGTLLGNAILVRISRLDFVAIGLVILLAAFSVADVLFLNLRERAPELVTLRTSGWGEPETRRLIGLEAVGLGSLGAGGGAALALIIGIGFLDVPALPLIAAAAVTAAGGIIVALAASVAPLTQITRLTAPTVLAEE
jgi:putative ABC transport system permease protein